jgi:hypothetical protein
VTQEESMAVVQAYYQAYRLDTAAAINSALEDLLAADFSLESPLVQAQRGGPVGAVSSACKRRGALRDVER